MAKLPTKVFRCRLDGSNGWLKLQPKTFIIIGFALIMVYGICPSSLAAGKGGGEINHYLIQARIQYDHERYEEAIEWWNKALAVDPQNREAMRYIKRAGEKLAKRNKKPKAGPAAEGEETNLIVSGQKDQKAVVGSPRPAIPRYKRKIEHYTIQGKKYYCKQRYNWAISEWKAALRLDPDNQDAADYIKRAEEKMAQKPLERDPAEPDMVTKAPTPETPPPVFQKPKNGEIYLDTAIAIGLNNHLPIQIAREQVSLARYKEKEVFRELFPQVTVRWDETTGIVSSKDYIGRKYNLKLQHPLYHGGELRYTWEQAKVNLKIAAENYEKTKEDYILELTKAYYDYVKAIRNFDVQGRLFKEMEKDTAMAKKEFDAGVSVLVDFLNVQSQYNQAYYSYLSSENSLALAKSNFLQLLNMDEEPSVNIKVDTEIVFKEYDIDLDECIKLAYENRTDLKINELSLRSAELGGRVTKSMGMPKVDLTTTVGKSGEMFTPGTIQMSNDWFVGAKVSVPWGPNTMNYSYTNEHIAPSLTVFQPTINEIHSVKMNLLDNLASYTDGKRSEIIKEQAYSDLIKGKQTAATQVREAYFNYQESALKVKNSIRSKELYEKEFVIIKERRLMDEAKTQDVIAAKVKLAGEEINYSAVLTENIIAIAKLNKAIGIENYFKPGSSGTVKTDTGKEGGGK